MQVRLTRSPRPRPSAYPPVRRGEAAELAEWRHAAWTMFWLLVIDKLLIMIALAIVSLSHLRTARTGWSVIFLLNWSWILLFGALAVGPVLFAIRLRRVRRKRKALIHAEWNLE